MALAKPGARRLLPASSTGYGRCVCPRHAAEICGPVFHKDFLFCGESETLLKKAHPSPFSRTSDIPKAEGLSDTQPLSNKISPPPKERGNFSVIGAAMRGYSKTDGTAFLRDRADLAKRGIRVYQHFASYRAQVRVAVAQIFCAGRGPLENLDGYPLALSQFSRRAAMRPCENWSAAPSTPRCIVRWTRFGVLAPTPARLFLPQAVPRLRCQT